MNSILKFFVLVLAASSILLGCDNSEKREAEKFSKQYTQCKEQCNQTYIHPLAKSDCVITKCIGYPKDVPVYPRDVPVPVTRPRTPLPSTRQYNQDWREKSRQECENRGSDYAFGPDGVCRDTSRWRFRGLD